VGSIEVFVKMVRKIVSKNEPSNFFGRALFIFVITIIITIYILLIFNQIQVRISKLQYWFLYGILGLLLSSIIVLLHPRFPHIKKLYIIWKKQIRMILEKRREERLERKIQKRKEKELKRKQKIEAKRKKRLEKQKIKEEKRKSKEDKKEKIITIRIKGPKGTFYFTLFLASIVIFLIGQFYGSNYFYASLIIRILALILMCLSLFGYRKIKKIEKFEKKRKKEKVPLIKELPKGLRIELGKYETDIDVLYKLIEQKGRIKLSAVSKYFGIDKKNIEEWATILEKHGLAKVYYPAVGGPELRKI